MAVKGLLSLLAEGMSPENLKRIGMLSDESAQNPTAVKTAQTKYQKLYEGNDQFRAREEQTMLNPQVVQRGLLDDRRIIMPEDIENTVLVPHKGDISGTDVTLTNIGGFDLPVPVTSRGGARYPNSPLTPEGNYWASMKTGAVPFQNKAEGLMESLKMDATGVYTAMGREANYFNQAFADGMLQWAQSMKLPKKAIKKFDEDLRKSRSDWVGLESPEARDQLLGMGSFKPEGAGKFRSAFTKKMSKAEYRDLGFPTITDIEKAFIDPDLAGTALGEAGFTMGRVGKGFDLNRNTNHPSYNTGIGGEYIGGFEQSVPPQIMYPDAYKQLEGVMTKPKKGGTPRLLYDAEKIDAIAKRQDLFQVADARWVDTASKWLEDNKGASNAALIAAVGLPATMAPQEAEAAPAGLLRQAAPVAMTGLLSAGMSEDSDASILGSLSKLGAGRQDLLGMAQKMANEGMDVQSIRERTGWEIGADGQWRTELPNTNTKINIPEVAEGSQYYTGTIADVIDDPELLSQYEKGGRKPTVRDMDGEIEEYGSRGFFGSLGDIAFTVDKNMPEGQGFHREGYFDEFGERQPETIVISGKSSPAEQRATLLHELQHSIQDREGFAAGGNQKQFAEEERIKDSFYERVGLTPTGSGRLQELEQKISDVGQRSMSLQEMSDLERLRVEKQISDRFNADTVGEAGARSPYGMYKGLMGEVEARNVETRDKMKPDFLRATPLELSEDVFEPRSQQIFRAGSDDELFRELEYLKYPDVRSNAPEYREAPVVQEQSFGDMVNEYANINQRAQAAEAQKFGLLMREDARLRDMGSASFGQVSPELAAYRRSQILPTIGEMGMGALEGAVDTVDFVSQLPTAISTMTMPKRTPLRDRLGGLLDYSFVDERDQRARDQARLIGGLLSPI